MAANTDISPKTAGAAVGGAVAVIVLQVLAASGIDLAGGDSAALGAGIATVTGTVWSYLLRDKARDRGTGNDAGREADEKGPAPFVRLTAPGPDRHGLESVPLPPPGPGPGQAVPPAPATRTPPGPPPPAIR